MRIVARFFIAFESLKINKKKADYMGEEQFLNPMLKHSQKGKLFVLNLKLQRGSCAMFWLAGTGSVGLKRYVFLLRNLLKTEKYMMLEMKQATPSSLQTYVNNPQPKWGLKPSG